MAWPSLSWMVCCECRIPLLWWGRNLWIWLTIDWCGTNLLVDVLCVCSMSMVNTWKRAFYRIHYPCQASLTGRPKTEAQPFQTTLVPNCAHTGSGVPPSGVWVVASWFSFLEQEELFFFGPRSPAPAGYLGPMAISCLSIFRLWRHGGA